MRKTLSLLLVIAMLLSMCACGANEETEKNSVQASSEATSLAQIEESTNETVFESVNLEQMENAEETIIEVAVGFLKARCIKTIA